MLINFDIGSADLGSVNALHLSDGDHIEKANEALLTSKTLFSDSEFQLRESGYKLTLYFKEAYASFNTIFKSSSYLSFKTTFCSIFPELVDQFPIIERKILIQEDLNNSLHELQEYERYGFFGSKEYIDSLKERVCSLEKNIITENKQTS